MHYGGFDGFRPYVSVAERRQRAAAAARKASKAGDAWQPVAIEEGRGRKIASTFWGATWCDELERHGDFANRLPRGRSYVRNGSVVDLRIAAGRVSARVMGSELYTVEVKVEALAPAKWRALVDGCRGRIDSLIQLLQGRFSDEVMGILVARRDGMIPVPGQFSFECSCPDWASMCKHVAAALYGVGARLDEKPDLLFVLRDVDATDLVGAAAEAAARGASSAPVDGVIAASAIGDVFGIALDEARPAPPAAAATPEPVRPEPAKVLGRRRPKAQAQPPGQARASMTGAARRPKRASAPSPRPARGKVGPTRKAARTSQRRPPAGLDKEIRRTVRKMLGRRGPG
jgi:uncharacterized Zn finger protein